MTPYRTLPETPDDTKEIAEFTVALRSAPLWKVIDAYRFLTWTAFFVIGCIWNDGTRGHWLAFPPALVDGWNVVEGCRPVQRWLVERRLRRAPPWQNVLRRR
jgi:hypothetical protein